MKRRKYKITNKRRFTIFTLVVLLVILTIINLFLIKSTEVAEAEMRDYSVYAVEEEQEEEQLNLLDYLQYVNENDVLLLAKAMKGEANCTHSTTHRSAVAWVILNQVDSPRFKNTNTVESVVRRKNNIQGFKDSVVVNEYYYRLAKDILCRYYAQKIDGYSDEEVGRTIPSNYFYWMGNGYNENFFTQKYHNGSLEYCQENGWDWSLPSPYQD